jgi:hypothetical protein
MKTHFLISTALGALVLTLVTLFFDLIFGRDVTANYLGWMFFSNLLISFVLGIIIKTNTYSGWKLTVFLFLIYFVIGHFNLLIEAYIFSVTDRDQTLLIILQGFLITLLSSPMLVYVFGRWQGKVSRVELVPRSGFSWLWRTLVGDLLYVFLYLLAGFVLYSVYPQLMDFYKDKVPPFSVMITTQFFRAALFILIAVLISRNTRLSLWHRGLLIGLFFAVVGGLASLIVPENEVMPDYIRFGHAFEVGISNFLFGLILTFLMGQKTVTEDESEKAEPKNENELNLI